jgi:DNA-binding transcriptional MerR regulator
MGNPGRSSTDRVLAVSEVIQFCGVTYRALRYYEEHGLISPIRDRSKQRWFGRNECERLYFIMQMRRFGLEVEKIKCILQAYDNSRGEKRYVDFAIEELAGRLEGLDQLRRELHSLLERPERAQNI